MFTPLQMIFREEYEISTKCKFQHRTIWFINLLRSIMKDRKEDQHRPMSALAH